MYRHEIEKIANAVVSGTELTDVKSVEKIIENCFQSKIAVVWSIEDVFSRAEYRDIELTEEQALSILDRLLHNHDANLGISWDVIDVYIDWELN